MENARTVSKVKFPADIPVSLIVAVQPGDEDNPQYQEFMEAQQAWINQSGNGQVYTVIGKHYIYHYAPDEVCEIISSVAQNK